MRSHCAHLSLSHLSARVLLCPAAHPVSGFNVKSRFFTKSNITKTHTIDGADGARGPRKSCIIWRWLLRVTLWLTCSHMNTLACGNNQLHQWWPILLHHPRLPTIAVSQLWLGMPLCWWQVASVVAAGLPFQPDALWSWSQPMFCCWCFLRCFLPALNWQWS